MQGQYVGVVGLQQRCFVVLGKWAAAVAVLSLEGRAQGHPGAPPAERSRTAVHEQQQ
jgi:hypothetical protein